MKRITMLLSVMAFLLLVLPLNVHAELVQKSSTDTQLYGTLTVMESKEWEEKTGGGKAITAEYYVTKTTGGYVYLRLLETNNVKVTQVLPAAGFTKVKQVNVTGGVDVVLKATGNVSGKTQVMTVLADIVDPSKLSCNLDYQPLSMVCISLDGLYTDKSGKEVTKEQYDQVCNGQKPTQPQNPDVPNNPGTGSVVPYVAVAGGLLAIAGVYFISKKSNKMYKL